MKKLYACIAVLLAGAVSLWADLPSGIADIPPRGFELGVNGRISVANSHISMFDIFKKTIELDFTKEPRPLYVDVGANLDFFINLNIQEEMGFGLFSGLEFLGQFALSKELQEFLQGNELNKTYSGDIGIGGSAFMEVGAHGYFHVGQNREKRFRIAVRPAYYFPLVYMKPNAHYIIRTSSTGGVYADFEYDFALYTPFEMEDTGSGDITDALNSIKLDPSNLSGQGGVDITAGVDYSILPKLLSIGAAVTHIPLFPSQLTNKAVIRGGKKLDSKDILDDLLNNGSIDDLLKDKVIESSHDNLQIFRPFKFGVHAVYTPFRYKVFSLALIPQIGYAYNDTYLQPHSFEWSAKARIGLFNIMRSNSLLAFTFSTGYGDNMWNHGIGVTLNLRAVQIDIGAASLSEDFRKSFAINGLGITTGVRFGW
ncbi:MAG: hypothetical protein LBH70_02930 [Spirochaetaceae bacterium]|jgi:hypothetical protein|nr:hypothetical protein [Spirochaetaceae bacterium]